MHPAPSLIVFTTLSGLGFGLMVWLGLGLPVAWGWAAFAWCAIAIGGASIGLLASTLHLGNPQRAWRALSQWRSSWLSREGVLAVATLLVFGLYALLWIFFGRRVEALGIAASVLALATVAATAMIYAQLRTVPRWHMPETPILFVLYALAGGALLALQALAGLVLLVLLGCVQVLAWWRGSTAYARSGSSMETATGLTHHGQVRLFEAPHTTPNYLMTEMVFVVGRRRAAALRRIGLALGVVIPALACLLALIVAVPPVVLALAALCHLAGVVAMRWLFYAEAEHLVGLYYGRRPGDRAAA
ncbi:MAG: DmsC/YnfH family molybdoenzyme membrane anchor subunit [Azospirillaceae bacterium]